MSDEPEGGGSHRDPLARLRAVQLELPERGTGARAGRRPVPVTEPPPRAAGPSPGWMAAFAGLLVVALVGGVALTYIGVVTVRDSTAGREVAELDPDEPGFEAFLEPTPTLLVVHEEDGALRSLALLTLHTRDEGGSVVMIPPSTRVDVEGFAGPLSVGYAFGGGIDGLLHHVQSLLGVAVAEHVVVDGSRWRTLTAPVAPLVIDNPDPLEGFELGVLELQPDEVASWLTASVEGESDLARMFRVQLLWDAWLDAVARSDDPAAVPGELESGIGRFVRGLASGPHEVTTLPVAEVPAADGTTRLEPDSDAVAELVARVVPYPRGHAAGARTRVRLLDGTGEDGHALRAAPLIVPAGAEIVIVGNAERFESPRETEVRYHDAAYEDDARRLAGALGVGELVEDVRQVDSFDVTIVLGTDI